MMIVFDIENYESRYRVTKSLNEYWRKFLACFGITFVISFSIFTNFIFFFAISSSIQAPKVKLQTIISYQTV